MESNGGSLDNVAEVFVLFLCGVQLVLRSGVLTILDLDELDVTPSLVEVFRSVLSGVGGQHRPKDLSKPQRGIHLVEIKYCEDTRP